MISRWARFVAVCLMTTALWVSPAYAQRSKKAAEPAQASGPSFNWGIYALVVLLLAPPIGLICRSSRR